jgi:hypothetical protein
MKLAGTTTDRQSILLNPRASGIASPNQAIMLYGDFAVEPGRRDRHLYRDDPPRRGQLKAGMLKN